MLFAACARDQGSTGQLDSGTESQGTSTASTTSMTSTTTGSPTSAADSSTGGGMLETSAGSTTETGGLPIDPPAWLDGQPLHVWIPIPDSNVGVSRGLEAYSGWAIRDDTSELFSVACGGHGDSSDNGVYSIRLTDDAPAWVTRTPPSDNPVADVDYYPDGTPSARHVYQYNHWVPQLGRVMLFGATYTYGTAVTFGRVDGWDPETNAWDPAGTWPDLPELYASVVRVIPSTGEGWQRGGGRWQVDGGYDTPLVDPQGISEPMAYDSGRDRLFSMRFGNGQDVAEGGLSAAVIDRAVPTSSLVTFTPSPGVDQLIADQPGYCGMAYDPILDVYDFYDGRDYNAVGDVEGGPGRMFVVTPNDGTTWDIAVVQTLTVADVPPPATVNSGINSRFSYVPALHGIVMMPSLDAGLYFMRTAE